MVRFFSSSSSLSFIMDPVTSAAVADACSTTARSSSDKTTYTHTQTKTCKHLHWHKIKMNKLSSSAFTSLCDPEVTERGLSCSDFSISSRKLIMLCSLASDSRAPPSGRTGAWLSCLCRSTLSVVRELESSSWGENGWLVEHIFWHDEKHTWHAKRIFCICIFTETVNSPHRSTSTCPSWSFWVLTISPAPLLTVSMCPANHSGWFSTEPYSMAPPAADPPCLQTFAGSPGELSF